MELKPIQGEVMRGGQKFTYVLVLKPDEWRARVFRTDGAMCGWVSCGVLKPHDDDTVQDDARAWVEHCIMYSVGIA